MVTSMAVFQAVLFYGAESWTVTGYNGVCLAEIFVSDMQKEYCHYWKSYQEGRLVVIRFYTV